MYVLVSPCILNPELRARGITRKEDLDWYFRAVERCRRFNIEIIPLPCPEFLFFGPDREPFSDTERFETPEFARLADDLEKGIRDIIAKQGPPLCIIGVDSSPCCGITTHYTGAAGTRPERKEGRGVFLSRFLDIPAREVSDFSCYRIYLAAPLFSSAEKEYNSRLARFLEDHLFDVFLPQEAGDDIPHRDQEAHRRIYARNLEELEEADMVVAVIDGADADSGTAWEMGYACCRGIPVIAIRTDFRMAGPDEHVNLMLEQSAHLVRSTDELLDALKDVRARKSRR
ncbi:MAG: nucleoside 2-deoxyribosyltransferase [Methanoregulaceae archaeon]|jgi:nucleoside 2-deoxyribosyltransferase/predicted secreted protein|nr:nucleoside 2-deoxyribosyltransferase [Methanoregulaceae archaeon]